MRGYALTGDPSFADRFLSVHAYDEQVAADLDSIAAEAGGEVAQAAGALGQARREWGSTRELPEGDGRTLGGFGLRRARERLRLFGGRAEMTSEAGGGTRAVVALPLDRLGAEEEAPHGNHSAA